MPQLTEIYNKYRDYGLEILDFPSNDFEGDEPYSDYEIKDWMKEFHPKAKFKIMSKISVNGLYTDRVWAWLRIHSEYSREKDDQVKKITWNYTKFLLNQEGKVEKIFDPETEPNSMQKEIETQLGIKYDIIEEPTTNKKDTQ